MSCAAQQQKVDALENIILRLEREPQTPTVRQQIAALQLLLGPAQAALAECLTRADPTGVTCVLSGTAYMAIPLGHGHAQVTLEVFVDGPANARTTALVATQVPIHIVTGSGSVDLSLTPDGHGVFDAESGKMTVPLSVAGTGNYLGAHLPINGSVMLTTGAVTSPDGKYHTTGSPQQGGMITLAAAGTLQAEILGTTDYWLTIAGTLSPPAN
jgi:hypothetical protein